jgi:hypothetical protein
MSEDNKPEVVNAGNGERHLYFLVRDEDPSTKERVSALVSTLQGVRQWEQAHPNAHRVDPEYYLRVYSVTTTDEAFDKVKARLESSSDIEWVEEPAERSLDLPVI